MRNLLNKININRTRTIYFLVMFVMIIGCYALNKSYSMFVQSESKKAVGASVPGLTTSLSPTSVLIGSKSQRIVKETIKNNSSVPITYRLSATVTTPTDYSDYNIQMVDTDDNLSYGTIPANSTKELYIVISNLGTSAARIKLDLGQNYTTVNKSLDEYLATCNIDNIDKFVVTQNAPYSYQTIYNRYGDLNVDGKINEEDLIKLSTISKNSNNINTLSIQGKNNMLSLASILYSDFYESLRLKLSGQNADNAVTNYNRINTKENNLLIGDVNGDNVVDDVDWQTLMEMLSKNTTPTNEQLKKSDINGNNVLDYGDLYYILYYSSGFSDIDVQELIAKWINTIGTRSDVETSYLNNAIMSTYVTSDLNSGEKNMFKKVTDIKTLMSGKTQLLLPLVSDLNIPSPSFTSVETAEKGLYQADDDYGTTYYFRGASSKNYVKLSGGNVTKKIYTFTSNNKAKASSSANTEIKFTSNITGNLTFDWLVSSETNYDKFTVKLNNTVVTDTSGVSINAVSGTKNGSVSVAVTSGTVYTISLTYTKDGSQDKNDDIGKISNLYIPSDAEPVITTSGTYGFDKVVENSSYTIADTIWRIVRINGDGTIRLVLDDVAKDTSGNVITTAFNNFYNDNAYSGYMYGTSGSTTYDATHENKNDSTIKTQVDAWYKTNIVDTNNNDYVADTLFCNDKALASNGIGGVATQLGYGTNQTYYASSERLRYSIGTTSITTSKPTFKCAENATNDYSRFTVNATTLPNSIKTNGKLTYPVGLLTADEVAYAGAYKFNQTNQKYYLYNSSISSNWWLSAPFHYYSSYAYEWYVNSSYGSLNLYNVNPANAFRPSINLKASVLKNAGDGTKENPYTVKLS